MTVQDLLKMIQKFDKKKVLLKCNLEEGGKELLPRVVSEVATAVQKESNCGLKHCSARGIARTLENPVSTMHEILRNILHCYLYKISHVQELFPSNLPARETFAL